MIPDQQLMSEFAGKSTADEASQYDLNIEAVAFLSFAQPV